MDSRVPWPQAINIFASCSVQLVQLPPLCHGQDAKDAEFATWPEGVMDVPEYAWCNLPVAAVLDSPRHHL